MSVRAVITTLSRGSLHDGRGIRTVVYCKGCNLSCRWCHNPECQSFGRQLVFYSSKCIGCRRCSVVCPEGHSVFQKGFECSLCGRCTDLCPTAAAAMIGEKKTPEEVFSEICKDIAYFRRSGGGVTVSGGECLLFPEFLSELLTLCQKSGIHTTVESAFCVDWNSIEAVYQKTDSFLIDIKHMDDALHRNYTGAGNRQILENIVRLSGLHPDITLRVPLIPTVNDSRENLIATGKFAASLESGIRAVELLRYNPLAGGKYRILGREMNEYADRPQTDEEMSQKCSIVRKAVHGKVPVIYRRD